jgi:soluble lytic murein transglycosylase
MARAWYDRARALSRLGLGDSARAMLRTLPDRFPAESVAGNALALAADLAVDRGDDSTARALWLRLADQLPASRFAPYARFEAALTRYVGGDPAGAAAEFDALASRPGPEAMAATYWAGRALAETGDSAGAMLRWRTVATVAPETYYALLAGRRLGLVPWAPGGTPDLAPRGAAAAATRRILLLERLGLDLEAGWEADELANANGDAAWLLDAARALAAVGRSAPAARLARRAIAAGTADTVTAYYLIYPVLHADVLGAESETRGLDPAFTAALIRQESTFDPEAVSGAGARGLMQVMPEVGRRLARQLRWPLWDPVLLFQPDVSLELGHFHLKNLFDRYRGESNVLVAYNAGGGRIAPWRARPGADDPEVFIERIPYAETRDYVRIVLRNAEYYRRMYDWTCGSGDDVPPEDRVAETGVRVLSCS